MENVKSLNAIFERSAWGIALIWLGVTWLIKALPEGIGLVGIGCILLGMNALRAMNNIRTSSWTITLGVLALVWGALELLGPALHLSFELPVFDILLIVLGIILLATGLIYSKHES